MAERGGRCAAHARVEQREHDARRGSSSARGYTSAWQRARIAYLMRHPLCVKCKEAGRVVSAQVVDHITPHGMDASKGRPTAEQSRLFWDSSNWQALCKACHDAKTAREDGGFR